MRTYLGKPITSSAKPQVNRRIPCKPAAHELILIRALKTPLACAYLALIYHVLRLRSRFQTAALVVGLDWYPPPGWSVLSYPSTSLVLEHYIATHMI